MNDVYTELELANGSEENYLEHHGVLGMKWGIRRYQNYDGSYTRKGVEHYRQAEENYKAADKKYKAAKKAVGEAYNSPEPSHHEKAYKEAREHEKAVAKAERKAAKKEMSKKYDQVKRDYHGDKGKKLYQEGHTITGDKEIAGTLASASLGMLYISRNMNQMGNKQLANTLQLAALGTGVVAGTLAAKGAIDASNLRAYYGHHRD